MLINEPANVADRFLRPVARTVLNSPMGKAIVSRWPLPWLFKRPLADYDFVVKLFSQYQLGGLEGDILELGSWLGFGTAELAALAKPYGKMVHTADRFPTDFGEPETVTAVSARRYLNLYPGLTQRQVFDLNTREYPDIVVHAGDIMELTFPLTQCFVCSVIDADHDAEEIRYYLELIWSHATPGGLIFVNDYGNPETLDITEATDKLVASKQNEILRLHLKRERRIMAIAKRAVGEP